MDREMLIEAAKRSCEHNWMTNYLIPLCSECGFTEDGFRYFNRGVEKGFDFALSLLQWKDVADGLPEVEGQYSVVKGSGKTPFYLTFPKAEDKSAYAQIVRMMWAEEIAAYIPVPIPEWKEQR